MSSSRFTGSSAHPSTTFAGSSGAAATTRRFASTVPESQYVCRYTRASHFHAFRQNVLVQTRVTGACMAECSCPVASTSTPRKSPDRSRLNAWSCAP